MSVLRIYFSGLWRDSQTPCPWALCDEQGGILQSGASLLDAMPQGHECVGIVAADRVLNIAVTIPSGGRRRLQALLPFAAEEFTLTDPEENHVVPGTLLPDGRRLLAVIDQSWLKAIVDAAQNAKLSLRLMVVESHLPVANEGSWSLVWDGRAGFVKMGAANTILDARDDENMPLALRLSLESVSPLPQKIELRFVHDIPTEQRKLPQWVDLTIPLLEASDWDWRRTRIPDDALNLLWGDFTPRAKFQEWWPKLRPAALLLLALLSIEIVGTNIEWVMLESEKNKVSREMQRTFRGAFGDSAVLVNAPLQMRRNLAELRHQAGLPDSGDFLPLLGMAGDALITLPVGSVVGMHYEAGRLDLDIKLARAVDFANLKLLLQRNGLGVRLGEMRELGNAIEARVTLLPENAQ
jgi:general secretion pathway protein L